METLVVFQRILRALAGAFLFLMWCVYMSPEQAAPAAADSILAFIISFCAFDGIIAYVKRVISFHAGNSPSKGERKF